MEKNEIELIKKLRQSGKSFGEIAKEMLITKSQARYYSLINFDEREKKQKEYEIKVCELAKKCTNINQILHILGKRGTNEYYKQIRKILSKNNVDISHFIENVPYKPLKFSEKLPIEKYLVSGSTIGSTKLKNRILKEALKEHKCERCGRTEWEGESIPLQLHHINGNRIDNRLENLQLLCPNCHTLTDNYCGKKLKKEFNKCLICGKEISRHSKLCKDCFQKLFKKKKIEEVYENNMIKIDKKILNEMVSSFKKDSKCPTKDDLLSSFKELGSFRAVGKKYGVSDKAVVKWCEKYDLPTKALEMRHFLREQYGELKWQFNRANSNGFKEYQCFKLPKRCLIGYDDKIEKIYSNEKEIISDGFSPKLVLMVCKGELKTHKHRKFKFLEYV